MNRSLGYVIALLAFAAASLAGCKNEPHLLLVPRAGDPHSQLAGWLSSANQSFPDKNVSFPEVVADFFTQLRRAEAFSRLIVAEVQSETDLASLPGFSATTPWRLLHSTELVVAVRDSLPISPSLRGVLTDAADGKVALVQPTPESLLGLHALAWMAHTTGIDVSERSGVAGVEKLLRALEGRVVWTNPGGMFGGVLKEQPQPVKPSGREVLITSNTACGVLKSEGAVLQAVYPREGTAQVLTIAYIPDWANRRERREAERFLDFLGSEVMQAKKKDFKLDMKCIDDPPPSTVKFPDGVAALKVIHAAWRNVSAQGGPGRD
jgi:hypothetical protein